MVELAYPPTESNRIDHQKDGPSQGQFDIDAVADHPYCYGFRDDVRFWVKQLHLWNGRQQWRAARASPFVFASDAIL